MQNLVFRGEALHLHEAVDPRVYFYTSYLASCSPAQITNDAFPRHLHFLLGAKIFLCIFFYFSPKYAKVALRK